MNLVYKYPNIDICPVTDFYLISTIIQTIIY